MAAPESPAAPAPSGRPFVHLHLHTDYSMLDGAIKIPDLVKFAKANNMPAVAVTDHGNMAAAFELYAEARKSGIQPIIGCEVYVCDKDMTDKSAANKEYYHLVLLAMNDAGYHNLCELNRIAFHQGFYYKPRFDMPTLAKHCDGLIALSACLGGMLPQAVLSGNDRRAREVIQAHIDLFGRDRYFLELQDHGIPGDASPPPRLVEEQRQVNRKLIEYAREFGLGLVATNDAHYLRAEHSKAHDVLLCIGTQRTIDDANRMRYEPEQFYVRTGDEMYEIFKEVPEACDNTLKIASMIEFQMPVGDRKRDHYPVFQDPAAGVDDAATRFQYLRRICLDGIRRKYKFDPEAPELTEPQKKILARMDFELGVIDKMGFISYFLCVWDFLNHARLQGIPVGPGRGSGAGSIVAYLTNITDIEPLEYGLLFERFLNPDRVSPPDFDVDICERRRQEVIDYVRSRYGDDRVCQIGTYGTLKCKAAIKDVSRVLGIELSLVNELTKKIPTDPKMTLKKAAEEHPEVKEMLEADPRLAEVWKYATVLENLHRNTSIHACGVIICNEPLTNVIPLARGANDEVTTQFSAVPCEDLGLLKMDFLGLRTLTLIQDTIDLVKKHRGKVVDFSEIPLTDDATYRLLQRGETVGVFQLESTGMQKLCREFGVSRIQDIIALLALYRPGPLQFKDIFVKRRRGIEKVVYEVPEQMAPILDETCGIMLYQEQIMQIVQVLAGFSLGNADLLRRAIGKKKEKEMLAQHDKFVEGCASFRGIPKETAEAIWENIKKFADYGFNKSHSAAYAFLSYRTAYLKANYPVEFMAALLTSELGNAEKISFILQECDRMGVRVKPPSVSASDLSFSVDKDCIRFGLAAIRGVGESASEKILEARRAGGPFKDLLDFCERVGNGVNKRTLESLNKAGAFDSFGQPRARVHEVLDLAMKMAAQNVADRASGQGSLFDLMGDGAASEAKLRYPELPEWPEKERLKFEKEMLGFYVSGHPIGEFRQLLRNYELHRIESIKEYGHDTPVRLGGYIAEVSLKRSKKDNRPFAAVQLEGMGGKTECMVFPGAFEECQASLVADTVVMIEGYVAIEEQRAPVPAGQAPGGEGGEAPMPEESEGTPIAKVIARKVIPIAKVPELYTREVHVRIREDLASPERLAKLQEILKQHHGGIPVLLCAICNSGTIGFVKTDLYRVAPTLDFQQAVRDLFGADALLLKNDLKPPEAPRPRWNGQKKPASA